jgi:hypothetical protein
MSFVIITSIDARNDIQQSIYWENSRSVNLGVRFKEYLDKRLMQLSVTPFVGTIRYDNVRCIRIDVFQYLIHYIIDEQRKKIIIVRVIHTKQRTVW